MNAIEAPIQPSEIQPKVLVTLAAVAEKAGLCKRAVGHRLMKAGLVPDAIAVLSERRLVPMFEESRVASLVESIR